MGGKAGKDKERAGHNKKKKVKGQGIQDLRKLV